MRSVPLALDGADEPSFKRLIAYWQGKHRDGKLPARRDIEPADLKPILAQMLLIDVLREPLDFRYRLAGTLSYDIFGYDLTGKRVRDIEPAEWAEAVWQSMETIVRTRQPQFVRLDFETQEGNRRSYRVVRLPLADDGETVDCIVLMSDFGLDPREFRAHLDAVYGKGG
jgi:hypothetical protein